MGPRKRKKVTFPTLTFISYVTHFYFFVTISSSTPQFVIRVYNSLQNSRCISDEFSVVLGA